MPREGEGGADPTYAQGAEATEASRHSRATINVAALRWATTSEAGEVKPDYR